MAAATVTRERRWVSGDKRIVSAKLQIAATLDTYVTKLHLIENVVLTPNTNAAVGCTVSGGTVTFVTGGALTDLLCQVTGL